MFYKIDNIYIFQFSNKYRAKKTNRKLFTIIIPKTQKNSKTSIYHPATFSKSITPQNTINFPTQPTRKKSKQPKSRNVDKFSLSKAIVRWTSTISPLTPRRQQRPASFLCGRCDGDIAVLRSQDYCPALDGLAHNQSSLYSDNALVNMCLRGS